MAGPGDLSLNPALNSSVGGINIAENCPASNVNDALRYLAAMIRQVNDSIPATTGGDAYLTKANAVFDNQPKVLNRGAILYHNDTANGSGRVFVQAVGGAVPGMTNGDILIEY